MGKLIKTIVDVIINTKGGVGGGGGKPPGPGENSIVSEDGISLLSEDGLSLVIEEAVAQAVESFITDNSIALTTPVWYRVQVSSGATITDEVTSGTPVLASGTSALSGSAPRSTPKLTSGTTAIS